MKRTIGLALASGLAFLVAGCAGGAGGGSDGKAAPATGEAQPSVAGGNTAGAGAVRDFSLQVKCPGIHLERTKLKWDDAKIMGHENVTPEEIESCEKFTAEQPKGYVPPPPGGAAQVGNATGPEASGGVGNKPGSPH